MSIERNDTVDAVMRRWPTTIAIFLRNRMRCVGCPVGRIHSIADASREHGLDLARLLGELAEARGGSSADRAPDAESDPASPPDAADGRSV